jgi:hypothetical protein
MSRTNKNGNKAEETGGGNPVGAAILGADVLEEQTIRRAADKKRKLAQLNTGLGERSESSERSQRGEEWEAVKVAAAAAGVDMAKLYDWSPTLSLHMLKLPFISWESIDTEDEDVNVRGAPLHLWTAPQAATRTTRRPKATPRRLRPPPASVNKRYPASHTR